MRRSFVCLAALLAMLLSVGAFAAAQDTPSLDVTEYTLDNGLNVILVVDRSAPTVAVNITFSVGGANDPEGRSGFAHLFEHMMFEETAHLETGELDNLVESSGGYLNAYTANERTVYYTALPAHQLPLALWFEADRLASLVVSEENFENQRDVVIEEYNLRVGNAPYGEAIEDLFTLPYTYAPYRQRVIGSVEDLNAATLQDVIDFHSTYYTTNNATLTVAGDIDVDVARALIDEFFAPIPAGPVPPALVGEVGEAQGVRREVYDPLANIPALLIGYPIPARADADFAPLEVTARLLGSGNSSRLAQVLLDTGMALDAGAFTDGQRLQSVFAAYAFANMGVELSDLEAIYNDALLRLIDEGPAPEELEKVINQITSERIVFLETVEGLAESVQSASFYFDDPQAVFSEIERFSEVTVEDVQRVVAEYLTTERATILLVIPGEAPADEMAEAAEATEATEATEPVAVEQAPEATEEATAAVEAPTFVIEQAEPPEPLEFRSFTLPAISEETLDNGLTVITIPRPEVPIVSVDVYFRGGGSAVPADQAGLTTLTANVLTRGTTTRTAQELAAAIEQVGGFMGADASADRLSVGVFALRQDADLAFELLSDVVINPTFPDSEVEIARQQALTALQDVFASPAALASRTFSRLAYGAAHPYGKAPTEASLSSLTAEQVRDLYASLAQPENAFMIVTGDVTPEDALALAESHFGGWQPAGDPVQVTVPEPTESAEPGIYLVDRPGSTQADFVIGLLAYNGSDPQRYAGSVLNGVLGGTFGARLSAVVREELGYTYSIYSSFSLPIARGAFTISMASGNDVAADALRAVLEQIELIREEPVPEDELNDVLNGLIGSEALRLETYQSLVDQIASFRLRGVPIEELERRAELFGAVDQAQVQEAAQTYLLPDDLLIVVVGDADAIEASLSEVAPVTVIPAE